MSTETSSSLTLDPVFMMVHPRGKDEKLALFNADEVIHSITSNFEGFSEADKLLSDFRTEFEYCSKYEGYPMPSSEIKLMALIGLLEKAYGLDVYSKGHVDEDDLEVDNA